MFHSFLYIYQAGYFNHTSPEGVWSKSRTHDICDLWWYLWAIDDDFYWFLWDFHGISMDFHGISMDFYVISMGFPWDVHGISMAFLWDFYWFLLIFIDFYWFMITFDGYLPFIYDDKGQLRNFTIINDDSWAKLVKFMVHFYPCVLSWTEGIFWHAIPWVGMGGFTMNTTCIYIMLYPPNQWWVIYFF